MPRRYAIALFLAFGCSWAIDETPGQHPQPADGPEEIAELKDRAVAESSGVAASRLNPGVYWTHNDSGNPPLLFAFDRKGRSYGRWRVTDARNVDWEDIAIGPGPVRGHSYIYVADIGDNARSRKDVVLYRLEEPKVRDAGRCAKGCATARATAFHLRYPDGPHDAEALLVHPSSGDVYIVSKAHPGDAETRVYVARARQLGASPITLALLAIMDLPEPLFRDVVGGITGGDIAPDGRGIVLSDYFRVYLARLPAGASFDEIWRRRFVSRLIGFSLQVEGVGYRGDGKAVIATSENSPCRIFEIPANPR